MKIYTRTGDAGETSLFGGDRVSKDHLRIRAYGTVDEANSCIGLVRSLFGGDERFGRLDGMLDRIQGELFVLGADLATPESSRASVPRMDADHVTGLEADIDGLDADLPELRVFILPGGHPAASALHVARTVCRRAERETVAASEAFGPHVIVYLNRLSDFLFVAARWTNRAAGEMDVAWNP